MKKSIWILAGLAFALAGYGENFTRQVTSLCGDWKFTKDASGTMKGEGVELDDSSWQTVTVPHDWAISGPFEPEGNGGTGKLPWQGVGWYRRTFEVDAETARMCAAGGALWLEFDGVMARPEVSVNGRKAGGWDYGYMSFRVDAAPFVKTGTNLVAVRADTRDHHSRWYPGAGIYRAARLVRAPAAHVEPGSVFITTPRVTKESADVRVMFTVTNRSDKTVTLAAGIRLRAPDGSAAGTAAADGVEIPAGGSAAVDKTVTVARPKLWDVEAPHLYTAEIAARTAGGVDAQDVRFGVRTIAFPADDGFHLNGRRVQIQGVDLHADMGPLGMAFDRSVMRRQLAIMKDMGVNALRTSHNAPDPQVLELCDEMGIVVWNECFDKWDHTAGIRKDEKLEEVVSRNLRAFARRDRNHPSVIIWSIGNEITPDGYDWNGKNPDVKNGMNAARFKEFRAAIREFDTTRPVAIGCCHKNAIESGMFAELDLTGWNYNAQYRFVKAKHPDKPCLYSESASALSSYGHIEQPPAPNKLAYDVPAREVGSYDHNAAPWSDIPDVEFNYMETDRYCGGEFVWTGIDYLGEPTPYVHGGSFPMMKDLAKRELARSSYFGIVDLMGVPKDRFWLYRSHWNKKDETLHIVPHWNWPNPNAAGQTVTNVPVYVYTSGDAAELFLNGQSLGVRRKGEIQKAADFAKGKEKGIEKKDFRANPYYDVCDKYRLRWFDVPYAPGELKAVAYRDGKKIGARVLRTAGAAKKVKLTLDPYSRPGDAGECVFVQVDVVDARGVRDPWAKNRVRFSLKGPGKLLAVGNGDPRGLEAFTETASHPLYFGKAVAVIRKDAGATDEVTLTVEADGLEKDALSF